MSTPNGYLLTAAGREMVQDWLNARGISTPDARKIRRDDDPVPTEDAP